MDRAVCVGINKYPAPNALHGCVNDIIDVRSLIINACHFDRAHIVALTDRAATAQAIKQALANVVAELKDGDRFLFWYSGHGAQLTDGDAGTDVICPVNFDFTKETSVTVQDFHDIFKNIPKSVTAVWGSDSCHRGDLERDFYRLGVPKLFRPKDGAVRAPAKKVRTFKEISDSMPNIALISGRESSQTSADAHIEGRYNGAFTHYFLAALEAPGGLRTALVSLVPKVQAALKQAHYEQIPELSGPHTEVERTFLQTVLAST